VSFFDVIFATTFLAVNLSVNVEQARCDESSGGSLKVLKLPPTTPQLTDKTKNLE
jgi:hypothetical protein